MEEFREIMNLVDGSDLNDGVEEIDVKNNHEITEVNKENLYIQNIEKLTK